MCRRIGEGTDTCWPHEQAEIQPVNGYTLLEEVTWCIEMRPSMRAEHQAADIRGITPVQLG
jgi:hypothetical protein